MDDVDSARDLILIVDPEELNLVSFRRIVPHYFPILTATSIQESRDIIQKHKAHLSLVITELKMTRGSGLDLLKETKELAPQAQRILTSTGFARKSWDDLVDNGTLSAHLTKPWDITRIQNIVSSL